MPQIYEVHLLDRKEAGLNPWKYSGSDYKDNTSYYGSSCHPDYKQHLHNSCENGKTVKIVRRWFDSISPEDLRREESKLQKQEGHKDSIEYYNRCDSIHPTCHDEDSKRKISNTLREYFKRNPTSMQHVHTEECRKKATKTRKHNANKWYYDPHTLEFKKIKTAIESIPNGWMPGRKPKKIQIKRSRDDIKCNVWNWKVYKNDELVWSGENISAWCESTGIKLKTCTDGYNKLVGTKKVSISYSRDNTIIENGIDTLLNGVQYGKKIGRSSSYVSMAVKKGSYSIPAYDRYHAIKLDQSKSKFV